MKVRKNDQKRTSRGRRARLTRYDRLAPLRSLIHPDEHASP
jgi:hypothetical protein